MHATNARSPMPCCGASVLDAPTPSRISGSVSSCACTPNSGWKPKQHQNSGWQAACSQQRPPTEAAGPRQWRPVVLPPRRRHTLPSKAAAAGEPPAQRACSGGSGKAGASGSPSSQNWKPRASSTCGGVDGGWEGPDRISLAAASFAVNTPPALEELANPPAPLPVPHLPEGTHEAVPLVPLLHANPSCVCSVVGQAFDRQADCAAQGRRAAAEERAAAAAPSCCRGRRQRGIIPNCWGHVLLSQGATAAGKGRRAPSRCRAGVVGALGSLACLGSIPRCCQMPVNHRRRFCCSLEGCRHAMSHATQHPAGIQPPQAH